MQGALVTKDQKPFQGHSSEAVRGLGTARYWHWEYLRKKAVCRHSYQLHGASWGVSIEDTGIGLWGQFNRLEA
jgi:hypothetical protein